MKFQEAKEKLLEMAKDKFCAIFNMTLIFVDCEAPFGVGAPSVGDMTEFGAVKFKTHETFYGNNCSEQTFVDFCHWVESFPSPRVLISDNPAYDWQWINFYFW